MNNIRPFIPRQEGLPQKIIEDKKGKKIIKPFSIVEFEFIRPYPINPHTENYIINPCNKPILKRNLIHKEIKFLLETIDDGNIGNIFENHKINKIYRYLNDINRSIGTVKLSKVHKIKYIKDNLQPFRISFSDHQNKYQDIPITDLEFQSFYTKGLTLNTLNEDLMNFFNKNSTYIRVGLGPAYQNYNLFVMGIYSFPYDYKDKIPVK